MDTISREAVAFIAARIAYPESTVSSKYLTFDTEKELEEAREEYNLVIDSIQSDEIREALDEVVNSYIAATIDHYCQLGVKQGIRFILDMISEGNENINIV